jgi:hypothetical protein
VWDFAEGRVREAAAVVIGVHHAHDDHILAGLEQVGHVEVEGQVAAFVLAHAPPVQPDDGVIIDGAKVQDRRLAVEVAVEIEAPAIPGRAAVLAQVVELRLPRHRHLRRAPSLDRENIVAVAGVDLKVPRAVQ